MAWLLILGLVLLMALDVPVAFAMLATSIAYLLILQEVPLVVAAQQVAAGTDRFLLLAIPFFFLAAEFMNVGGVMTRLVNLAHALVGHIRGGPGHVNVVSSMLFAGMSGSAVADVAGMGKFEIDMMRRSGYGTGFAAAITAASATIGPVIPPSIPLVVYGSLANVSVGKLFMAGVVPGLLMGLFLMAAVWRIAIARDLPHTRWEGLPTVALHFARSLPILLLPAIILGGIALGVFTPTEAAVVAAAYALLVGLALRELKVGHLPAILLKVGTETARIMLIVVAAGLYSWILAREGLPQAIAAGFLDLTDQPWLFLLIVNALLLVLGTLMEPLPIMVIVVPALLPVVQALGIDLVHFGVIVTLNLMIGLITPPVGLVMFTVMDIARLSLGVFCREIWPFLLALVLVLLVITYAPWLVLALPRAAFGT